MNCIMTNVEVKDTLQGLAQEISNMTLPEKLISLERLVLAELEGSVNIFWTKVAMRMLVDEHMTNKFLSVEQSWFEDDTSLAHNLEQEFAYYEKIYLKGNA